MTTTPIDRLHARNPALPALFTYGFRPFFLGAAVMAALAVPVWLMMLVSGIEPAGPFPSFAWHAHEMIFGYLAAVMAGFILTAVPNWTGRLPVTGWPLVGLFSLWVAGRVASAGVAWPLAAGLIDLAFPVVLAGVVWREILSARQLRNLSVAVLITVFGLANGLFHLHMHWPGLAGYGERLALAVAAMLIGLIGGRITPSFTRNWMAKAGIAALPAALGRFDQVALVAMAAAVTSWVVAPDAPATGVMLLAAGLLHLVRLARWRGVHAAGEPIVVILHVGYFWLVVSLLLMGLAAVAPAIITTTSALHALTTGAIGTMTLAVMTRASLGHTGRPIVTSTATLAIYVLVSLGAVLRVAGPLFPTLYMELLIIAGVMWSAAFGLFVLAYGPKLLRPGLGRT